MFILCCISKDKYFFGYYFKIGERPDTKRNKKIKKLNLI